MRNRANHPRRGAARKLCIGIQSDDVSNAPQNLDRSCFDRKAIELMKQEFVQIEQLSPLPLPAHPDTLACIEDAMAMQEDERSALCGWILRIQRVDTLHC